MIDSNWKLSMVHMFSVLRLPLLAFAFAIGISMALVASPKTTIAQQIESSCGCGEAKCGGCLGKKLFLVKKPSQIVQHTEVVPQEVMAQPIMPQSVVTSDVVISTEYLPEVTMAPGASCGTCAKQGCLGCKSKRSCFLKKKVVCPSCDCDFCELKVDKTEEEKTCFEVKQKEVCIPAVTLPWKKNCPPTKSKVRVVNVLGKKKYKCPACKYKWSVYEPEAPQSPEPQKSESLFGSSDDDAKEAEVAPIEEVDPVAPKAPKMNVPEPPNAKDLKLDSSVPALPVEDA